MWQPEQVGLWRANAASAGMPGPRRCSPAAARSSWPPPPACTSGWARCAPCDRRAARPAARALPCRHDALAARPQAAGRGRRRGAWRAGELLARRRGRLSWVSGGAHPIAAMDAGSFRNAPSPRVRASRGLGLGPWAMYSSGASVRFVRAWKLCLSAVSSPFYCEIKPSEPAVSGCGFRLAECADQLRRG